MSDGALAGGIAAIVFIFLCALFVIAVEKLP